MAIPETPPSRTRGPGDLPCVRAGASRGNPPPPRPRSRRLHHGREPPTRPRPGAPPLGGPPSGLGHGRGPGRVGARDRGPHDDPLRLLDRELPASGRGGEHLDGALRAPPRGSRRGPAHPRPPRAGPGPRAHGDAPPRGPGGDPHRRDGDRVVRRIPAELLHRVRRATGDPRRRPPHPREDRAGRARPGQRGRARVRPAPVHGRRRPRPDHPHGGESRLSNFLLYQAAYSELYFTDVYFPSFRRIDFLRVIRDYQRRRRRYGR